MRTRQTSKLEFEKRSTVREALQSNCRDLSITRGNGFDSRRASFSSATFTGDASFGSATFTRDALFDSATFKGSACFEQPRRVLNEVCWARLSVKTDNSALSTFERVAQFDDATFRGEADFNSPCRESAPSALQAHALSKGARFYPGPFRRSTTP